MNRGTRPAGCRLPGAPLGDHFPAAEVITMVCQVCQVRQDDSRWQWAQLPLATGLWRARQGLLIRVARSRRACLFRGEGTGEVTAGPGALVGGQSVAARAGQAATATSCRPSPPKTTWPK